MFILMLTTHFIYVQIKNKIPKNSTLFLRLFCILLNLKFIEKLCTNIYYFKPMLYVELCNIDIKSPLQLQYNMCGENYDQRMCDCVTFQGC